MNSEFWVPTVLNHLIYPRLVSSFFCHVRGDKKTLDFLSGRTTILPVNDVACRGHTLMIVVDDVV
jgi:hypothetical protein